MATELNLHTSLGWRWCYYIGSIFAVISTLGTLLFYWPPTRPQFDNEKTRWQEVKELDFVGLALYSAGLVTFLVGLTWAGQTDHPWRSVSVIAPIIAGFCCLIACFAYDFTLAKRPLFPLVVFRKLRDFTILLCFPRLPCISSQAMRWRSDTLPCQTELSRYVSPHHKRR